MIGQQVLFSHKTDHWSTPSDFYRQLDSEFHFTMDPCPLNSKECGLTKPWGGAVFCNPPYNDIRRWLEKGVEEVKAGRAEVVVFLIPARTDTAWFHDLVYHKAEIRFIRGRLKFGGAKFNAPFPCMLAIFRGCK